ncbi:MAG: hypothetical protein K8S20_15170 [Chloroflexi bacterium]|nr:hypothetical protein [Chloroflexota bacterium]
MESRTGLLGCGAGAGVDSAWEQRKFETALREMLKKAAHREAAVPSVQQLAPASVASTGCTLC